MMPFWILSPQHLDSSWKKQKIGRIFEATNGTSTKLFWTYYNDNKTCQRNIKHHEQSNVPLMRSAPGFKDYISNVATHNWYKDDAKMTPLVAFNSTDKEDEVSQQPNLTTLNDNISDANEGDGVQQADVLRNQPIHVDFQDEIASKNENKFVNIDPKLEMLLWHYRLALMPFQAMKRLAQQGSLPKQFLKCMPPMCAACQYGRATRRPWRTRAQVNQIGQQQSINQPGDCVSIDQMDSPTPGLISQIKGIPTIARYTCVTIFVDHYSDVTFVHFQKAQNEVETIDAKETFERWTRSHKACIKHYLADNGRFGENLFMAHIARQGQTISFCGVNAHFQNGKAERRIRTLQELARSQMLHAKTKWPMGMTTNLWPYAVSNVSDIMNDTNTADHILSRIERFTKSTARP